MAVFETYSKRQKRLSGDAPDVFTYDLNIRLKNQVVHILNDVLGNGGYSATDEAYRTIVEILRREFGELNLVYGDRRTFRSEFMDFFIVSSDNNRCLDALDIAFRYIDVIVRKDDHIHAYGEGKTKADEAIDELNIRFKEHAIGFQFVDGKIIRVDSELIHQEAVKPALRLLNTKQYAGAHEEFINAYEHYKAGKNKEALNDCLKAFESTMKAICDKRGWTYQTGDTAKRLIDICFANGLIPSFWQQQFNSLRSLLESSIPTGRNKLSGHGQGATPQTVPDYLTAYMLHMTASTLVFLTTAEKELS
ncbi:hypothetical protein ILFOPFJJ_02745 [Ensifer psoraleae]|uniref:STM4504/CBY_0614 family protein n=1 Tax=Sinorhizobium psoraleae TaxID=520838 RepID=UPI001569884F|nr:hypothetical protein [Sinorhizobium psoraleae]NRP71853.1 hypothetical protein [Sinorhizobium psoraleae]